MNIYSSPTLLKETLYNGHKIPNVFYEMNPLREPNKRIDHFRVDFRNDSLVMNKTQSFFRKAKESAKTKPKKIKKEKNTKNTKNKLYNSLYSKLFLRINFDRPREIRDELGVIISRHYRSLDINSKEYPENIIRTFYFNKYPPPKKYIKLINNNDCGNSNFFRTEIKIPINKNNKNIDADNERKKKYKSLVNLNNKNFYSQNGSMNSKMINYENYSSNNSNYTNNIDSKRFVYKDKFNFQGFPSLLINSNNKNTTNGIKRPNNGINSTRNKFLFSHEEEKINKKWENNIKQKNIVV